MASLEEKPLRKKLKTEGNELENSSLEENNLQEESTERYVHYYLQNFLLVLNDVEQRYSSLFSPEETKIIENWKTLSYSAQQLYVRLFSRKPLWFKVDGLNDRYKEIINLTEKAIPELIHTNFLRSSENLTKQTTSPTKEDQKELSYLLYSIAKQTDLRRIIDQASLQPSHTSALSKRKRKPEKLSKLQMCTLIASHFFATKSTKKPNRSESFPARVPLRQRTLVSFFSPQPKPTVHTNPNASPIPLHDGGSPKPNRSQFLLPSLIQNAIPNDCIALTADSRNLFKIIQHLFFLSPWQDQSLLVLTGMERIKFPELVEIHATRNRSKNSGIFQKRTEFTEYQHALFLEMELNYALHRIRPSTQTSLAYSQPMSSSSQWSMSVDEVASLDLFDDSFLVRYNYNWQCHTDSSPQHTLRRVLHHCCLHLFHHCYQETMDAYRQIQPRPIPLSEQLQAMISTHNSLLHDTEPLARSLSQPLLEQENITNESFPPKSGEKAITDKIITKTEIQNDKMSDICIDGIKNEPLATVEEENKWSWINRYRAEWIMTRIVTHGIEELEKQKDYTAVTCMYRLLLGCGRWGVTRRGQWWERLSLVLTSHLKNPSYALSVALLALEDPFMPDLSPERISLMKRVTRLHKPPLRWSSSPNFPVIREAPNVHFTGTLVSSERGKKNKWKPLIPKEEKEPASPTEDDTENAEPKNEAELIRPVNVETLALQYYRQDGWEGLHCEGGVIYPLFSMLLYPVLYADIPNVFQSRFQEAPLDLLSSDFYESRKDLFDVALQAIRISTPEELSQQIEDFWILHRGERIQCVDWNRYPLILYQTVCTCFGGEKLSNLLRIIAQHYKASRSGMPDLLLWKLNFDEEGNKRHEILFSEVKGPRDRLSAKQILWIHKMLQASIPVEVIHVQENKTTH